MIIQIPQSLNGKTFYESVLPVIYFSVLNKDYDLSFDMSKTELANPEGITNLLVSALMVKNKYNGSSRLWIPKSEKLQSYLHLTGFFRISKDSRCPIIDHDYEPTGIINKDKYERFIPKIYGLFTEENGNYHLKNIKEILKHIQNQFGEVVGVSSSLQFELKNIYDELESSISQLIKNTFEHNYKLIKKYDYRSIGYYMAQKTPYDTIEVIFSDCGMGYWKRILQMLDEGVNGDDNIDKFKSIEKKLRDETYLFKKHNDNPNLVALNAAVLYRENSKIPGIHQIKKYALNRDGYFHIHSGNYSKYYSLEKTFPKYYENSYFSGSHIKIEIPLNK
jgi:hypothetical protein